MAARWQGILTVTTLLAAGLAASPVVLDDYAQQILAQAFFFAIAAITVDLLWGYTGVLTFGQSAFFGIGVYTVALALAYYVDGVLATAGAIVVAMAVAALVGAGVGWLAFFDRASPIYAAIVTLALPVVFTQIILSGGAYTGSSSGLPIPAPFLSVGQWFGSRGGSSCSWRSAPTCSSRAMRGGFWSQSVRTRTAVGTWASGPRVSRSV